MPSSGDESIDGWDDGLLEQSSKADIVHGAERTRSMLAHRPIPLAFLPARLELEHFFFLWPVLHRGEMIAMLELGLGLELEMMELEELEMELEELEMELEELEMELEELEELEMELEELEMQMLVMMTALVMLVMLTALVMMLLMLLILPAAPAHTHHTFLPPLHTPFDHLFHQSTHPAPLSCILFPDIASEGHHQHCLHLE
jgi:hypothetical protein